MATIQIAVNGSDCYRLLSDGTLKQLENGSAPSWKILSKNTDNVKVIAADTVCLLRKSGELYRLSGNSWNKIRGGVTNMWGKGNTYYIWDSNAGQVLREDITQGTWQTVETNSLVKDLIFSSNALYGLSALGQTTRFQGVDNWEQLDSNPQAEQIAVGKFLYKRHKNGLIYAYEPPQWKLIGNDLRTVQIAAGDAGLFQLQKDGSVYKYIDGRQWELSDSSSDNSSIAVAKFAYRVTNKGIIYRLEDNINTWKSLEGLDKPNGEETEGHDKHKGEDANCVPIEAEQVYDAGLAGSSPTLLRIGNGAAGQSGLIKGMYKHFRIALSKLIHVALGEAFIKYSVARGSAPFKVAWYKSDTTESIRYLKDGTVDAAITYTPAAEQIAMSQGIATKPSYYAFREHILLVGPESNPADLPLDDSQDIYEMFSQIYTKAEAGKTPIPVRFLSRFDKSATNIKDSEIWIRIGQVRLSAQSLRIYSTDYSRSPGP